MRPTLALPLLALLHRSSHAESTSPEPATSGNAVAVTLGLSVGSSAVSSNGETGDRIAGAELAVLASASHFVLGVVGEASPHLLAGPDEKRGGLLVGYEYRSGRLRLRLLGEFGMHAISNVGDAMFSHPIEGTASADLAYAGARLGISSQRGPFVFGAWAIARHDVEEEERTLSIESASWDFCLFGPCADTQPDIHTERYRMGGNQLTFVAFIGVNIGG